MSIHPQAMTHRMDQPGITSTRGRDPVDPSSNSGVAFTNGQLWKDNRKLFITTLNAMGVGDKNKLETIISEETADFCANLKEKLKNDPNTEFKARNITECVKMTGGYSISHALYIFPDFSNVWAPRLRYSLAAGFWTQAQTG